MVVTFRDQTRAFRDAARAPSVTLTHALTHSHTHAHTHTHTHTHARTHSHTQSKKMKKAQEQQRKLELHNRCVSE